MPPICFVSSKLNWRDFLCLSKAKCLGIQMIYVFRTVLSSPETLGSYLNQFHSLQVVRYQEFLTVFSALMLDWNIPCKDILLKVFKWHVTSFIYRNHQRSQWYREIDLALADSWSKQMRLKYLGIFPFPAAMPSLRPWAVVSSLNETVLTLL